MSHAYYSWDTELVTKRRVDLTEWFDKVDLGVKSIGSWSDFEETMYERALQRALQELVRASLGRVNLSKLRRP